jgi:hypothetical protein
MNLKKGHIMIKTFKTQCHVYKPASKITKSLFKGIFFPIMIPRQGW